MKHYIIHLLLPLLAVVSSSDAHVIGSITKRVSKWIAKRQTVGPDHTVGQARINAYPIDQCPKQAQLFNFNISAVPTDWNNFRASTCNDNGTWSIACSPAPADAIQPANWFQGGCLVNESCIDGPVHFYPNGLFQSAAYCVSINDTGVEPLEFVALTANDTQQIVTYSVPPENNIEIILTKPPNGTQLFQAAGIAINPRDTDNNTSGLIVTCSDCSYLNCQFPAGTNNIEINITMAEESSTFLHAIGLNLNAT